MHGNPTPNLFARVAAPNQASDDFLEIEIGGRKAQVFRPLSKGARLKNYYVKGYPPAWGGKAFYQSTGFATKGLALDAARKLWKAAIEQRFEALKETKMHKDAPAATIGELLKAHEGSLHSFNLTVEAETARGYRNALRRLLVWARHADLVKEECERLHLSPADRERIDRESSAVLTEELVEGFFRNYLAPAGKDRQERDRRLQGAIATFRLARMMFEPDAMKCYRGLALPAAEALSKFLKASTPQAPKLQTQEITTTMMREMAAAALKLKRDRASLYLVHLLFRHAGLRNDEIEHAQVGWIERLAEPKTVHLADGSKREVVAFINVVQNASWSPKASEGRVPLSADVLAELEPWLQRRAAAELLVPASTKTDRWELINIGHNDFVRPWLGGFRKRSYELRRWAATMVATLHQSGEMAEHFLRHAPTTTAGRHYLTQRPTPAPITLADCGGEGASQCRA